MMIRKIGPTLLILIVVSSTPLNLFGQEEPERDWEKERAIVAKLEAIAPESVASFESATQAFDSGDYEKAAIEYRVVLEAAPDFDPALRRLGGAYVALGQYEKGTVLLERAVTIARSPANLFSLAYALGYSGALVPGTELRSCEAYLRNSVPGTDIQGLRDRLASWKGQKLCHAMAQSRAPPRTRRRAIQCAARHTRFNDLSTMTMVQW